MITFDGNWWLTVFGIDYILTAKQQHYGIICYQMALVADFQARESPMKKFITTCHESYRC